MQALRTLRAAPRAPLTYRLPRNALRSLATTADYPTVSDAIKNDHRELESYYNNILSATDVDTKIRWQNQYVWELARHSIGEELIVYPAFEQYLKPGGESMAAKDRAAHQDIKERLYEFQSMYPTDTNFEGTLKSLMATVKEHIIEEEEHDLPALEKALKAGATDGDSAGLAKSFVRTKMLVPTRSHPSAPDRPPWETVAGLMAAPIDKIRDIFARFPKEATPKA
ncbi:hypothetical protein BZA05DRAFT_388120 [Tricharina praecox]|uniref:uncharacterized protein n=1 Tax=Tricharina praecox TaxID=43433 RepID=UPI00222106F9|nr:uncharacterized protein BZA05DRAFT_388120 [Tricharina praecox]KAI5856329.1 hypothetical protein BZA05DRAFT_388120 [Tricharina praecox]